MNTLTDYMQFQPGPCSMCGAKNYPLSFGGANICPACDCGIPPEVSKMKRDIASITAELRHLYQNMVTEGAVKDTAAIAKGLLGPQIERLEKL